jgi:hypothetical protein
MVELEVGYVAVAVRVRKRDMMARTFDCVASVGPSRDGTAK